MGPQYTGNLGVALVYFPYVQAVSQHLKVFDAQ